MSIGEMSIGEVGEGGPRRRGERIIECRFQLPAPPERVYEYFADPSILDRLTPDLLRFEVLTELPVDLRQGTTIDYRLRWRGLPLAWRSEITAWQPPHLFTYVQRRGPYRRWLHEHHYQPIDGGTLVIDRAEWSAWGGSLVQRLIEPDLVKIFRHRARVVRADFGAEGASGVSVVACRADSPSSNS